MEHLHPASTLRFVLFSSSPLFIFCLFLLCSRVPNSFQLPCPPPQPPTPQAFLLQSMISVEAAKVLWYTILHMCPFHLEMMPCCGGWRMTSIKSNFSKESVEAAKVLWYTALCTICPFYLMMMPCYGGWMIQHTNNGSGCCC